MTDDSRLLRPSRRGLLTGALAVAGALVGCGERREVAQLSRSRSARPSGGPVTQTAQPTLYVPHGGGPWPFVSLPGYPESTMGGLREYLTALPEVLPAPPRAVLVVSAHWEEAVPTLMTAPEPPMLYDYYGFPAESYEVRWPAPGSPDVAAEVRTRLERADITTGEDPARGFDHGTFVVTKLMYPAPSIPTFQLSLTADLDPARQLAVGRALAPLRREGVFLLGSGFSYHNMRDFRSAMSGDGRPREHSRRFDDWLAETVQVEASARDRRLVEWASAPSARACHPREEHLLPLMVCAGAAEDDLGTVPFQSVVMGVHTLAAQFG